MREWSMKVFVLDQDGNQHPADVFQKVVYNLHPTFENPVQSWSPPFTPSTLLLSSSNIICQTHSFHGTAVPLQQRRMGRIRNRHRPLHDREDQTHPHHPRPQLPEGGVRVHTQRHI